MGTATYVLEVDWNGDDDFGDTGENITSDAFKIECRRGRDRNSMLVGRSTAGRLTAVLDNRTGTYSSLNSSSPIAGNIRPNRKVRLRTTSPSAVTLWTGYLDKIIPSAIVGPFNTATLYASGALIKLNGANAKVSPPAQENAKTGTIIGAILDDIDWPSGDRDIDTDGLELGRWYVEEKVALDAMREIEDAEGGFIFEGLAWDIGFETRYHRYLNNLSSVATFSDASAASLPYEEINQDDPMREIFNEFTATVQPYHEDAEAILWTLVGETPSLAAGASRTYIAQYPNSASGGAQGAYVDVWTTPVVGTDITQTGVADGNIGVSVVKKARTMEITITNNHGSAAATLTLVQAKGVPVLKDTPFKITASDAASQDPLTGYNKRSYPLASPWYQNSAYAEGSAAYFIAKSKDPRAFLSIAFTANKSAGLMTQALTRTLSERINIVADNNAQLGIDLDFHIEAIVHRIDQGKMRMRTTFEVSPAEDDPGYWILDTSDDLDTDTILAY